MDFEDDVVETSDVEELEELRTSRLESSPVAAVRKFGTRTATEDLSPPRKKMKLAHNASVEDQKSSPSPARSILTDCNTPHRSQSSSLTFPTTSPGHPQYSSSRTQTPDIIYNTPSRKLEEDVQITALFTSPQSRSQDPQLLVSPSVPQPVFNSSIPEENDFNSYTPLEYPNSPIMHTTTPMSSPPGPRYRSQSADPFSSISSPSSSPARPSGEDVNHDDLDDLLSFSPAKPASSQVSTSPLSPKTTDPEPSSRFYSKEVSPEARRSLSPSQASNQGLLPESGPSQSLPTVGLAPEPETDNDAALAQILNEQRPRYPYPLRTRRPAQMRPYTAEARVYEQTLKNNPEAVVKFKNMDRRRRHPDDHYEQEGTQQDGYTYEGDEDQEDDAEWEEQERKRLHRQEEQRRRLEITKHSEARDASSEREPIQYPGILQDDLSSEDEEEKRQMNALSKEGLKLLRQERKKRKAEEKERRRLEEESRKAKRFPVPKGISVPPKASSSKLRVSASPRRSNGGSDDHVDFVSSNSGSDPFRRRRDMEEPAHGESTQSDQPDFIADYFPEDEGFPMFNEDYPMEDVEGPIPSQHSPPPPSTSLRNSYDGAINVDSDQDEEMSSESEMLHQSSHSQSSTTKIGGIEIDLPANKTKLLSRMMPKVMIASLAKKEAEAAAAAKKKKRRTLQENGVDVVHSGPLLPGQTRVQTAVNPKDVREIKGDSESELEIPEDSDSSSSSHDGAMPSHRGRENVVDDSESDEDDIIKAYRPPSPRKSQKPKALDFDDFDGFNSGSDGDVQIVSSNIRKKRAMGRLRDPSAIDYMLARPRTLWGSQSSSVRSGGGSNHRASSGYKIDVVTSGAKGFGRGQQALLSFDGHQNKKPGGRPKSEASAKVSKPKHINSLHDDDRMPSDDVQVVRKSKRMSLKELKKLRRKAEKARGVWTMRSNGDRITTGKDTAWITVDIGDEYFHRALEPLSSPGPSHTIGRPKEPSSSRVSTKTTPTHQSSDPGSIDIKVENMKRPICIPSDFKLSPLHSGMSFGGSTYIRKGLLHELLKVACSSQEPSLPNYPMTLLGFELGPTTSVEEISSKISGIYDALFEFATGLPDPDSDLLASQWSTVMRVVCQLVSWHLKNAQEQEAAALRNVIWKEITRLVAQVHECSLDFVEGPALVVCWFFVELSVRSAPTPVVGCPPGPFKDSVHLLMQHLLQFGLRKTMKALEPEPGVETELLDGSSPAHLAAELWVRLIHVLDGCAATQEPKYKIHPFWQALIDVLPSRIQACKSKSMKHFEISDDIWRTIFSICNLSQFSAHGMTMNQSHLTACWDVVAFALKAINLKHSPEDHDHLPLVSLMKRDNCVALAAIRCFHLRDKWKWRLDGASMMFNQLAEIFRSRKFCNLLHEDEDYADYPKFFRDKDWDLLSSYDPKDSAFAIFLKLIYQAVKEDPQYAQGNLSPKVRKLLSMAVPTGALSFSKTDPPGERDLTMLYNRMAALAIVTDLNQSACDDMIAKGRSYVSFFNADDHSRIAVIRALTDWAQLLVSRGIAIEAMGGWIEEIATVIGAELEAFAASEPAAASSAGHPISRAGRRLTEFSNVLLGAVRQIIESYAQRAWYPQHFLISSLKPLTSTSIFRNNAVKKEVSLLVNAVFEARAAALPPSRPLPATTSEDRQESQDFGNMGLDVERDDVDWATFDASLALVAPSDANFIPDSANRSLNDSKLRIALSTSQLDQRIYDFTVKAVLAPGLIGDALKNYTRECDNWLRLWLSCGSLDVQAKTWNNYLRLLDGILGNCKDERWARRVRLSVMLQILKLHPMSYPALTNRAFEALLYALVSDNNTDENGQPKPCKIEREYAAMMLSIGGLHHPLLLNQQCLPKRIQGMEDYNFLPEEFLGLRLPLLQVIFKNLNESIRKQLADNVRVDSTNLEYVKMCCAMFSGMRYCLGKSDKAPEGVSMYNDFCFQVVDALKQNPDLCKDPRMTFWVHSWPKCLLPPRADS
ncbi:hypothetical protein GALMADRAFT_257460 [Galerina marginata CBS 339.88]|uniref:Uncharacterized protein n=1 Tax=Galerina marginata (strain CBS 339.88) TaxID=685588 RepID=A0A067SAT2_GALM3|nr:hypothetical protein GALMADRAFT_257460 [Galerina marginata CBS 339.88]